MTLSRHNRIRILTRLTQPRIKHIKRHLIALGRTRNRNQPLIIVVLGLIDLDDASRKLSYLVNLSATLADNGSDHVVRDEDLLCDGLIRHALCWLLWRTCV